MIFLKTIKSFLWGNWIENEADPFRHSHEPEEFTHCSNSKEWPFPCWPLLTTVWRSYACLTDSYEILTRMSHPTIKTQFAGKNKEEIDFWQPELGVYLKEYFVGFKRLQLINFKTPSSWSNRKDSKTANFRFILVWNEQICCISRHY